MIVKKEPGKDPEAMEWGHSERYRLEEMQIIVGGIIEMFAIPHWPVSMRVVCHEEARFQNPLPQENIRFGFRDMENVLGTILVVRISNSGNTISLTERQVKFAIDELKEMAA
jgi:hypothetical protein